MRNTVLRVQMSSSGGAHIGDDRSNGWEDAAAEFIAYGRKSTTGVAVVERWATTLPPGGSVLDLGCGPGTPRSAVLIDHGLSVYAVDASPTLLAAYSERFPSAKVACEPAEESRFFGRTFDGVLAWGLLFLLSAEQQQRLLRRAAKALAPDGSLLFTAPTQTGTWEDATTGRVSRSLGAATYESIIRDAGLHLVAEYDDEGDNHYYDARRRTATRDVNP